MAKLTAVTAISMMFIGSRNCITATRSTDGGFSAVIWFGPNRASRATASGAQPVRDLGRALRIRPRRLGLNAPRGSLHIAATHDLHPF